MAEISLDRNIRIFIAGHSTETNFKQKKFHSDLINTLAVEATED